ncbi:PDZ domain-containing protein [Haloimpatiens sp. FM7330]|uniref:PDZ domain-containing protein n=1 Tax=Haloimpatiens sp. FM7330 TaxID=3298610 RepID=UPI003631845E
MKKDAIVNSNQVKEGDILEAIDGKTITSIAEYNEILKNHLPGDKVKLTFNRKNKKFNIIIPLKEKLESKNK